MLITVTVMLQRSCHNVGFDDVTVLPPHGNWAPAKPPPAINAPAVVLAVIALLAAVHGGLALLGEEWQGWSMIAFALIPARFTDPQFPMLEGAQYWSLVSYMLLHGDWMHLTFNCLWLLVFGTPVARYLGGGRFVLLCILSGAVGGLASLALHWGKELFVIGASGAVSGLLAAAIPIMYGHRVTGGAKPLGFQQLVVHPRALMFMAVWLVVTLVSGATGWTGNSFLPDSGIAWEAHLGGFIGGLAAFYGLVPRGVQQR